LFPPAVANKTQTALGNPPAARCTSGENANSVKDLRARNNLWLCPGLVHGQHQQRLLTQIGIDSSGNIPAGQIVQILA